MISERGSRRRLPRLLACAVALAFTPAGSLRAAHETALTEYQVEAAFLYHFAKYITWPPHAFTRPDDPIIIGVLGDDPFGEILSETVVREKPVQGRPLRVVRGRNPADFPRCHILFISGSEEARLPQHLAALQRAKSTALTVGESKAFLEAGGVVRFVIENNKVRFEINPRNAEHAGLTISSKLLSLARNTRERG